MHIDRAWRGHLNTIKDRELAHIIYHNLRILMEEKDITTFEKLLSETQKQLSCSPLTREFSNYNSHYANRKQQWALCYRKYSHINTNMYAEAFHRVHLYERHHKQES